MSHTETVTFTNCRTYTGEGKKSQNKKKSQRVTNAPVIPNFRTFICIPYFDCEMCFPEVRIVDGEIELYSFLCHAHPCVVLTHHLTLPPDTLHHLYNRYSMRCTCQEQSLQRERRGEQLCQAVDRCTIWFFKGAWQWSYHLITIILDTVHCVKYMSPSAKRPGHNNWHPQSPYITVLTFYQSSQGDTTFGKSTGPVFQDSSVLQD